MEEEDLDLVLVPLSLLVLFAYHLCLLIAIIHYPLYTVHGLDNLARERWVATMMADPQRNGVLAVQTLQNNIQASTVLATTAITLFSLINVFVGATSSTSSSFSVLIYGNKSTMVASIKFVAISLSFIIAFICNIQSIRYYTQANSLISIPAAAPETINYLATGLNWGSNFWLFGLRTFYLSITLFMWIFGPIFMLVVTVVICGMLCFFDTTSAYMRRMHQRCHGGYNNPDNDQYQPLRDNNTAQDV